MLSHFCMPSPKRIAFQVLKYARYNYITHLLQNHSTRGLYVYLSHDFSVLIFILFLSHSVSLFLPFLFFLFLYLGMGCDLIIPFNSLALLTLYSSSEVAYLNVCIFKQISPSRIVYILMKRLHFQYSVSILWSLAKCS